MSLAYTTWLFSVPHSPARPSRTTGGLILYGAMGGRRHRTASGSSLKSAAAGCDPFPAFRLLPGPLTCTPAASVTDATSRCEPLPAFPLIPDSLTCPAWPSVAPVSARCEPILRKRLTPASRDSGSWLGTMAAGAREQAASCDAFVLSRRRPAPGAPPSRTSPTYLIAKTSTRLPCMCCRRLPVRGTFADAWNIVVRTRGVFTHRDDFQKPACVEKGLVRTGTSLWSGRDCRCEFRQARSRTPAPDGVLAVVGMTDGVWQGWSVTRILL